MNNLTHLSLFSGIGGLDLAAESAGFTTVGQCEWADYPAKVLEKHWPDVPRWRDIRDLSATEFFARTGIRAGELTCISGGFPCQPFSVAGKQKGKGDDRYLWPEMLRVIKELRPRWVIGENVPGILRIAADDVCKDLERAGYEVGIFDYEAAAVGAPHRRERIFFVAYADSERELQPEGVVGNIGRWACNSGQDVADTDSGRFHKQNQGNTNDNEKRNYASFKQSGWAEQDGLAASSYVCHTAIQGLPNWANVSMGESGQEPQFERPMRRPAESGLGGMVDGFSAGMDGCITWPPEPDIPRIATGIKNRVGRLKALGNAVVPQHAYPIFRAIAEIEEDNDGATNK